MKRQPNRPPISAGPLPWLHMLGLLVLLCCCTLALAGQVAGTVTQLSGPLMAKKANGAIKMLALKSEVEDGDTLVTQKNTYALIKFIDNGEMTLRPDTTLKIDQFVFDAAKPETDSAAFSLVKGGLRSITGLLGKRNKERFLLKTPAATIGIRGTTFIVNYVPEPTAAMPTPGLHLSVLDGIIFVSNNGGGQQFNAGQFGYTSNFQTAPVLVPNNPNIQFSPPTSFAGNTPGTGGGDGGSATSSARGPDGPDCIVR